MSALWPSEKVLKAFHCQHGLHHKRDAKAHQRLWSVEEPSDSTSQASAAMSEASVQDEFTADDLTLQQGSKTPVASF